MKYDIFKGLLFCGCMMSIFDSEDVQAMKRTRPEVKREHPAKCDTSFYQNVTVPEISTAKKYKTFQQKDLAYTIAEQAGLQANNRDCIINIAYSIDDLYKFTSCLSEYARKEHKKVGELYQQIYNEYWVNEPIFFGASFSSDLSCFTGRIYRMQYYEDEF